MSVMSRISKQSWEEIDYLYSRSNLEKEQFRKMTWGFQNLVFNSQLKLFIKMFCCSKTFERVEAEAWNWNKNERFISFHFVKKWSWQTLEKDTYRIFLNTRFSFLLLFAFTKFYKYLFILIFLQLEFYTRNLFSDPLSRLDFIWLIITRASLQR